jgi:hypothetical protein
MTSAATSNQILELLDSIEDELIEDGLVVADAASGAAGESAQASGVRPVAEAVLDESGWTVARGYRPRVEAPPLVPTLRRFPDAPPVTAGVPRVAGTCAEVLSKFHWAQKA